MVDEPRLEREPGMVRTQKDPHGETVWQVTVNGAQQVRVLGVDGCPGGWIGAVVDGSEVRWRLLPDAGSLLAVVDDVQATGVDMPIGLARSEPRRCDLAARAQLGPRRSSVFAAPVRGVLRAESYDEACDVSRAASGRALSLQAWHLVPRIADLDAALPDGGLPWLAEMHPELSFATMAGAPLPPKKNAEGRAARIEVLGRWLPDLRLPQVPRPARTEDALDALAVAWSARRWWLGEAKTLPDPYDVDERRLPMRIVC
jgi:predicted RNase H-like nuclease